MLGQSPSSPPTKAPQGFNRARRRVRQAQDGATSSQTW